MRSRMVFASGDRSSEIRMRTAGPPSVASALAFGDSGPRGLRRVLGDRRPIGLGEHTLDRRQPRTELAGDAQLAQAALDGGDRDQEIEPVQIPEVREAQRAALQPLL